MAENSKIEVVNSGIVAAKKVLDLYLKGLDDSIPWKTFQDMIKELDRFQGDYSQKTAKLIGEVTTLLMNAVFYYFSSAQSIYEFCDLSRRLLKDYVKLSVDNKPENAGIQKVIISTVFGKGVTQMSAAQESISKSVLSFNDASGKLVELKESLNSDFDSKSEYYQNQLKKLRSQAYGGAAVGFLLGPLGLIISYSVAAGITEGKLVKELDAKFAETKNFHNQLLEKIQGAVVDIDKTKTTLQDEKKAMEVSMTVDDVEYYRQIPVPVAEALIKDCEAYLTKHGKKDLTK